MNYGMIGLGNMGGAILRGMVKSGRFENDHLLGFDVNTEKAAEIRRETGIEIAVSVSEVTEKSDVIILAVKPQFMQTVMDEIRQCGCEDKLLLSIAAGLPCSYFEREAGGETRVVRAMPNLNAAFQDAIVGICAGANAKEEDLATAEKIFSSVGESVRIAEDKFAVFSAVAGASPAFTFMYADALAMAAVRGGIPRDAAMKIASAAVRGSGTTLVQSGEHPSVLRDRVCSPGGTTIEGVTVLEENGFAGMIMDAVMAVIEKDGKLGK